MKRTRSWGMLCLVALCPILFSSCKSDSPPSTRRTRVFVSNTGTIKARPTAKDYDLIQPHRVSTVTLQLLNHPDEEMRSRVSRFDVAVAGVDTKDGQKCVLLDPLLKLYSGLSWSPIDFYYNRPKNLGGDKTVGKADIYFDKDDNNRNGGRDTHLRTVIMDSTPEIQFLENSRTYDSIRFYLQFQKGKLTYHGLIKIQAEKKDKGCTARAYLCQSVKKGKKRHYCTSWKTAWQIDQIRAHVDKLGAIWGKPVSHLDVRRIRGTRRSYQTVARVP